MNLTFRGLIAVVYLTNYDILTVTRAEDATIVGYVNTNTTLICDREFYNYPGWYGPNGTVYSYVSLEMINPACSRLVWASNNRDLVIRETNMTDAGVYYCSTPNSSLYRIQLVVRVPPDPPEIQNKVGSTVGGIEDRIVTLTCISRGGKPAPYLNWYRGTTKLTSTKTVTDQSDGTTSVTIASSFTATRSLDKTNYTCKSSFDPPDWPLSTHAMLFLSLKPSHPVINGAATVTENNNVHLQCRSTGCRPEGNISWTFDGQTIVTNVQNTPVSDTFTITSDFVSRPLDRADNGKSVMCRVGHESLTSFWTVRQYLHVQYPPDITVSTTNTTTSALGHYINCSAYGVPSNYEFTTWTQKWAETGVIIRDKLTSSGKISPSTQYLHFLSLSYQDTGEYICGAGNGVKNLISTGAVYLLVKASPLVTKFSNVSHAENMLHKVQAFLNKQVYVHLTVYSNAGAIVAKIFKLSGNALTDVNGTLTKYVKTTAKLNVYSHVVDTDDAYELTIYHTIRSQDEFGMFVLYLTNDIGTTTLKFEITSEGPPETPKAFATLQGSETSSSIGFSWYPGFHGDADQTFHIEYRSEGHEWQQGVRVFGGKVLQQQLQIDVDGLESGSSYLFRIYASNIYGNSEKSLELLGRTIEEKTSSDNTASVAGWSTAAVLGILLTVIGVLFLLHRNKRLSVCRKTQNRTETREVAFSDLKTKSKTETYSMSSGTPASTLEGHSNDRYAGNVNDELDPEKDATHLYSMINEGTTQPNQRHENNEGYSGNVYDELDPEKGATHLYSIRHENTEQPKQRQENNQGSDKKTYANTSASKIFPKSVDDSKKSMPGEGDSQALTYSNLNLMP